MNLNEFKNILLTTPEGVDTKKREFFTDTLVAMNTKEGKISENQEFMYLVEETGELLQAASKYIKDKNDNNKLSLMEEMGDVIITIYALAKALGIDGKTVDRCVHAKMKRHLMRIGLDPDLE